MGARQIAWAMVAVALCVLGGSPTALGEPTAGTPAVRAVTAMPGDDAAQAQDARKRRRRARRRAGCSRFCRQAGPAAGDGTPDCQPAPCMAQISRSASLARDGTVRVRLRCLMARRCVGAIVLYSDSDLRPSGRRGGGDFSIAARHTAAFSVPLTRRAISLLHKSHRLNFSTYVYVRGPRIVLGGLLSVSG